jgi:hypothetical protein
MSELSDQLIAEMADQAKDDLPPSPQKLVHDVARREARMRAPIEWEIRVLRAEIQATKAACLLKGDFATAQSLKRALVASEKAGKELAAQLGVEYYFEQH